jgi:hypothetical protein
METDTNQKIRELIDRDEIWSVILRYTRGIDRCDRDLVLSCYHDDAIDDHHTIIGRPAEFVDQTFQYHRKFQTMHHHIVTNHTCDLDGDDAHTETYYTFIGVNVEPPHLLSMGRYIDHLQRRNALAPPLASTRDRNDVSYLRPVTPRPLPSKENR